MDALSDALKGFRLSGAIFIDADLTAPWAVVTPLSGDIAAIVATGADRVIPYHLVTEGECTVSIPGGDCVRLTSGDIVLFPHGDRHILAGRIAADEVPRALAHDLGGPRPDRVRRHRDANCRSLWIWLGGVVHKGVPQRIQYPARHLPPFRTWATGRRWVCREPSPVQRNAASLIARRAQASNSGKGRPCWKQLCVSVVDTS